jgi:hypothetical protein
MTEAALGGEFNPKSSHSVDLEALRRRVKAPDHDIRHFGRMGCGLELAVLVVADSAGSDERAETRRRTSAKN